MRRGLFILGTGLVLTAAVLTLNSWSVVVEGGGQRRAVDQIQVGMRRGEVESILGSEGRFRSFATGNVRPGSQGVIVSSIQELRWEDAHETVDVEFRDSEVAKITHLPKAPVDVESLWWTRAGLALLVVFGFVFLLEGLGTRSNPRRTNAASSATPPA
jgi:hypothetical protein